MMHKKWILIILLTNLFASLGHAQWQTVDSFKNIAPITSLTPYRADYTVHWHGIKVGKNTQELKRVKPKQYLFESRAKPFLRFLPFGYREISQFSTVNPMIQPLAYQYEKQEGSKKKSGAVIFDWSEDMIHNQAKPRWESPLSLGMQDKLSHALQLRHDLIQGKRDQLTYTIVDDAEVKQWHFEVVGEETLETPLGPVKTLKLKHHASSHRSRETFFWLAEQHGFLLIQLEQWRDGKKVGYGHLTHLSIDDA